MSDCGFCVSNFASAIGFGIGSGSASSFGVASGSVVGMTGVGIDRVGGGVVILWIGKVGKDEDEVGRLADIRRM